MSRRRLWVISELFYPEQTSTGYFLTRIAEGLAERFDVYAICARPTYSQLNVQVPWTETHRAVRIFRMRSTRFAKDAPLGRMINLVSFSFSATLFCLLRFRRGDVVLVVTNPPTIPPLVGLVAKFLGVRRYLLVHDVYPEVLVATGLLREGGVIARALGQLTTVTYRLYDQVITLGRDMAELAVTRLHGKHERVTIISNWGDVDEITPIARSTNPFARRYNPQGRTLIQFSGNIGRTHDVATVLEAARLLRNPSEVQIQFVGSGGKARLVNAINAPMELVTYLPRQPREMLGPMLSAADAVVIAFVDRMLGVSVPSRMYNVMAAGTPIIAMGHPDSELALVVSEESCGWILPAGDARGLADLIDFIATPAGRAEASARGRKGRDAAERRFALPKVLAAFTHLLEQDRDQASVSADH